jgi:predicted PurR-regulated permease PerM
MMFSLLAFGSLFGFTGLLVAVPASAAIGVVVRYLTSRYTGSELYYGHGKIPAGSPGESGDGKGSNE